MNIHRPASRSPVVCRQRSSFCADPLGGRHCVVLSSPEFIGVSRVHWWPKMNEPLHCHIPMQLKATCSAEESMSTLFPLLFVRSRLSGLQLAEDTLSVYGPFSSTLCIRLLEVTPTGHACCLFCPVCPSVPSCLSGLVACLRILSVCPSTSFLISCMCLDQMVGHAV